MTRLYLIRHGETPWNVEGRYQGQLDPPLTSRGHEQARAAAEQLALIGFDAIYSSDLARARQTAEALAARTGLPVHTDPRLREIHQGAWQGVLIEDIRAAWAEALAAWQRDPWAHHPPGGERLQALQARLEAAINDIAASHPAGQVAVFTHKLPIALMRVHLKGYPPDQLWSLIPNNCTWEILEIEPEPGGALPPEQ